MVSLNCLSIESVVKVHKQPEHRWRGIGLVQVFWAQVTCV